MDNPLVLGGREFRSRLIVGTGKYSSNEIMRDAIEASGAEIVTVAVRGVSLPGSGQSILDFVDRSEEHTSELQSQSNLVCRLLLEKKKNKEDNNKQQIEQL